MCLNKLYSLISERIRVASLHVDAVIQRQFKVCIIDLILASGYTEAGPAWPQVKSVSNFAMMQSNNSPCQAAA